MNVISFKKIVKAFLVGVMTFAVGLVLAEEFAVKNKVPNCKGADTSKWDNCYGKETSSFDGVTFQGMWRQGKSMAQVRIFLQTATSMLEISKMVNGKMEN